MKWIKDNWELLVLASFVILFVAVAAYQFKSTPAKTEQ